MDETRESRVAAILARGLLRLRHCAESSGLAARQMPHEPLASAADDPGGEQPAVATLPADRWQGDER
jgi:hypothetical protein